MDRKSYVFTASLSLCPPIGNDFQWSVNVCRAVVVIPLVGKKNVIRWLCGATPKTDSRKNAKSIFVACRHFFSWSKFDDRKELWVPYPRLSRLSFFYLSKANLPLTKINERHVTQNTPSFAAKSDYNLFWTFF